MVKRVEATSGSTVSVGFIPIKTKGKEAGYKFVLID
jgi:ribosomal protein L14E/L6E/L27E